MINKNINNEELLLDYRYEIYKRVINFIVILKFIVFIYKWYFWVYLFMFNFFIKYILENLYF